MTVYIGGAITKHATFHTRSDWKIFDGIKNSLNKFASPFQLFIDRYTADDDTVIVIASREMRFVDLPSNGCFEGNLNIPDDPTFNQRATAFIEALEKEDTFSFLH